MIYLQNIKLEKTTWCVEVELSEEKNWLVYREGKFALNQIKTDKKNKREKEKLEKISTFIQEID